MIQQAAINKNKIVVYTAIIGGYDKLREPRHIKGVDYVCFTDNKDLKSRIWSIKYIDEKSVDARKINRKIKMLPHLFFPNHNVSVYVDGNIKVRGDIVELVDCYLREASIAIPPHPDRNDVYEELTKCKSAGLISINLAETWMSRYKESLHPEQYGLFENNVIVRRHNDARVVDIMEAWWQIFESEGGRDQLSLVYLAHKKNVKISPIRFGPRISRRYFEVFAHEAAVGNSIIDRVCGYILENRSRSSLFKTISRFIPGFYSMKARAMRAIKVG